MDSQSLIAECLGHRDYLFAFIRKMTGNSAQAEDILQECYCQAIAKIEQFRGESDIRTWLTAIAKNQVFQHFKMAKRNSSRIKRLQQQENQTSHILPYGPAEMSNYLEQVKNGCLYAMLYCLPVNQRCVFILVALNGLTIAQAATIIRKSPNAARILLHRAKASIKDFLCDSCEHLAQNPSCSCRNMVEYSIRHELIHKIDHARELVAAKRELRKFQNEIELLASLPQRQIPADFLNQRLFPTIFAQN